MKVKADENEELDLAFSETTAEVMSVEDVPKTIHGAKVKLNLVNESLGEFSVFINNVSMTNLIETYGDDDKNWVKKSVELKQEKDDKYKTDMIVIYPVK